MIHNRLLSWVSERGEGSLTSFRRAHDWLASDAGFPAQRWTWALRSFQALGHIEISWARRRWQAAPTTIATMVNGGGYAFLCGARTRWLLRRIDSLEADPTLSHLAQSIMLERPISQPDGPYLQLVTLSSDHDIEALCDALGVRYAAHAAERLLTVLPPLSAILQPGRRIGLPGGVFPSRMAEGRPGEPLFSEVVEGANPPAGAYCTRLYDVSRYFYVHTDGTVFEAGRGEVVYAELRRQARHVLRWAVAEDSLLVPARFRLPDLYDRAAVLRTGLLPEVGKASAGSGAHYFRYRNVDLAFAQSLAHGLGQRVRIVEPDSPPRPAGRTQSTSKIGRWRSSH